MPSPAEELLAVYAEISAETAEMQQLCRACGGCCDFGTHGEILYASLLERQVMALAGPPPVRVPPEQESLICPYRVDGKCGAREFRALGCRTYFCREPARSAGMPLYEKYRARVAEISRRAGLAWDYRQVMRVLREQFPRDR